MTAQDDFEGLELTAEDFTGQDLRDQVWKDCRLVGVTFDRCDLRRAAFLGCQLEDCTFRGAKLAGAIIGGRHPWDNRFQNCDFSKSTARSAICQGARFLSCGFEDVRWEKIDFFGTLFADCVFSGQLTEVMFTPGTEELAPDRNELAGCDFSDAELRWVDFRGIDLDNVVLPGPPNHFRFVRFGRLLGLALNRLSSDPPSGLNAQQVEAVLRGRLKTISNKEGLGVWSKHDLVEVFGSKGASTMVSWLEQLEPELT